MKMSAPHTDALMALFGVLVTVPLIGADPRRRPSTISILNTPGQKIVGNIATLAWTSGSPLTRVMVSDAGVGMGGAFKQLIQL